MRTTLTLDDDLAGILQRRAKQLGQSFKEVVNSTLRNGLAAKVIDKKPSVTVRPHDFGTSPGIDLDRLNQLVDELAADDYMRKAAEDDIARH